MPESSQGPKKPLLGDSAYDWLKKSTTVVLPAIGALYFALAQIWNLPRAEEVVGSIAALNAFLGVILGISTKSYNQSDTKYDGDFELQHTEDGMIPRLVLNEDHTGFTAKDQINLRIVHK